MATYIVRDTKISIHTHPYLRSYIGVPITVHVDNTNHQIIANEVHFGGNPMKVENTLHLDRATITYDPDEGVANVELV